MDIQIITQTRAKQITGLRLPAGLRWYWVSGLEFYPRVGKWSHTWACDDGLSAVIGMAKRETEAGEKVGVVTI